MKFRFLTSIPGFIEGRVIEVERITPDIRQFIKRGVLVAVHEDGPEVATVDPVMERAVHPVGKRRRAGGGPECPPENGQ